ncbi:hypothetical protein I553_2254 [Mycobacterium xenopi 4042]|uniref:Uncharacterized protein n=1 Tax=Mycobacterium xenopi 4042 TaxID=1299334 RepID=X8DLY6_MYCXE|nr:hypothetical protein I553_2254 [Mycobacterium xenopi 4042]
MIMPGRIPLPAKARRIGYDTVTSGQLDVVGFPAVSALPRPTRKGPQMTPRVLRLLYEVLSRVGCNPSLSAADVPDSWLVERIEGEHPLPPGRALDLAELDVGHDFSLIVDSGCYYGLAERQRDAYAAGVTRVASPGRYCSRLVSPGFRASSRHLGAGSASPVLPMGIAEQRRGPDRGDHASHPRPASVSDSNAQRPPQDPPFRASSGLSDAAASWYKVQNM